MTRDVADPVALAPNAWSDRDLGVELNAHLEVSLKDRLWNWERTRGGGVALEANHGVVVALLWRLRWSDSGRAVDGFV